MSTTTSISRRQTAFRLDKELLFYLRRRASRQNKSLNAFVEDVLYREVQTDMEGWPVIKNRIEPSEELRAMQVSRPFTAEEMAEDDRLSYILSK